MQRLMRVVVAAVAAFGVAVVGVGAATAAATPTGGPIQMSVTVENGPSEKIVLAGAIADWGHTQTVDRDGKPNEDGHFEKVTLKKGTFMIDTTALDKKLAGSRPQVASEVTCSAGMSASGPVKLFNGTGLYKGISGTANVTVAFTGIGPRYHSGAKKGQCDQDSEPLSALGSVLGRGTVKFG